MKRWLKKLIISMRQQENDQDFEQLKQNLLDEGCVVEIHSESEVETLRHTEDALWITDDAALARALILQEQAVLWYQHAYGGEHLWEIPYCIEGFSDIDYAYLDQVFCRYRKLPWTVMETERLRIREIAVEDVDTLYKLYEPPAITRYMEGLFPTIQEEKEYTAEYIRNIYGFYGYGVWILECLDTGEIIGRAGLEYKEGRNGLELGFMLGEPYQHQGYALEACRAILQYSRDYLEVDDFYALVMKENAGSIALLCRLGFRYRESVVENGICYDMYSCQGS